MRKTSEPTPGARVLGVDYGGRRVGLAVSDELGLTAQPLVTLTVSSLEDAAEQVAAVARTQEVTSIVVGYPFLLSGRRGELAERVDRFIQALADRSGLPVERWDERLTTVEAARLFREHRPARETRRRPRVRRSRGPREGLDRVAASLLLQSYLARRRGKGGAVGEDGRS